MGMPTNSLCANLKNHPSILWYSNPPWSNSGYGVCARHILRGLKSAGFEVGCAPNFGFSGGIIEVDGYPIYPMGGGFSEVETVEAAKRYGYDIVCAQYDLWPLNHLGRMCQENQIGFVPYVPIDHEIVLPPIAEQLRKYALHTVAMCKYGEKKIREIGVNDVTTIYHGVDCPVFKPMNEVPKEDFRQNLGFESDSFIIGMVQMNKGNRKLIPRQFEAIKLFIDHNPDVKVRVYAHTEPKRDDAFDLPNVLSFLGLNVVHMPDSYQYFIGFKPEDMAAVYNGCDVLLSATSSEGFGLPIAEAQSCGIPVIATDCTSMTELLEPTPELRVPVQTMDWNPIPARYSLPSIEKTVEALERVLNTDPQQYQSKLRDWALKNFDWNTVIIPQWVQLMQKVGEQIEEKCWRIPTPSSLLTAIKDEIKVIQ